MTVQQVERPYQRIPAILRERHACLGTQRAADLFDEAIELTRTLYPELKASEIERMVFFASWVLEGERLAGKE